MKLFVFAALVAAASAARLEHLERSYLPPDNNAHGSLGNQGGNGLGSGNNHFGVQGSNGFGANGGSNGFGSHGVSKGFGANSHGSNRFGSNGQTSTGFGAHEQVSNGFGSQDLASNRFGSNGQGASHVSNGFGSSQGSSSFGTNGLSRNAAFGGATSNQYLPPNHGPSGSESGSNGFNNGGSSIKPACFSCGSQNQYNQGSRAQIPSSNYGVPQLGSRSGSASSTDFGASESLSQVFGSTSGSQAPSSQPQFGAASRQYLAPKYTPSQNPPQQPFDENTGYIY